MTGTFFRSTACAVFFLAAAGAHANPAPQTVADLLSAAVAATGEAVLTYDGVTAEGDSVTLTGVKLTATADGSVATIPALVIAGAAERLPGGLTAAHINFDQGSVSGHGDTATWATASLDDVVIPSADEVKARAKVRPFKTIAVGDLKLSGGDLAAPIEAATFSADIGDVVETGPSNILVRATGVRLPTGLLTNALVSAVVGMLDYKEFLADVSMDSEYDTTAHTVTIHLLTIDAVGVGKITIAGKASGFSISALTDRTTSKEARADARLDQLTVRVDNAGFVERLLDMQAGLLGGTRDDVRSQLTDGALPFALSFVKNTGFRDQFLAAMTTFLQDPRSLTITFAPEKPVPLGQVMRTAARSPGALPDLLTPTVEANN